MKKCEPNSILTAAVLIASLNLQVNPSFGEAYIVPFKGQATFQVGVHGYVQLALRTGQYKRLHAGVIHEGEIRGVNPLTGEFEIGEKNSDEVVGYVAHFNFSRRLCEIVKTKWRRNRCKQTFSMAEEQRLFDKRQPRG